LPLLGELAALVLQLLLGIAGGQPGVQLQLDGQAEGTAPTACGLTWLAPGRDVSEQLGRPQLAGQPLDRAAVQLLKHLDRDQAVAEPAHGLPERLGIYDVTRGTTEDILDSRSDLLPRHRALRLKGVEAVRELIELLTERGFVDILDEVIGGSELRRRGLDGLPACAGGDRGTQRVLVGGRLVKLNGRLLRVLAHGRPHERQAK